MTDRERAEQDLTAWAAIHRDRDRIVRSAHAAGVTKHRIHQITGISRVTIDRLLTTEPDKGNE
jgi:DNA-binding transcriptional regulator LsrR (DeoR family)